MDVGLLHTVAEFLESADASDVKLDCGMIQNESAAGHGGSGCNSPFQTVTHIACAREEKVTLSAQVPATRNRISTATPAPATRVFPPLSASRPVRIPQHNLQSIPQYRFVRP